MSKPDWVVLTITLFGIIAYGLYKSSSTKDLDGYFRSNRSIPWYIVLMGIMGTQASAVTFLSAPGQAYTDGMRFVQYYFGLPFAMVVVSASFVPVFRKLKLFTAYEFLEKRFDLKTRTLTSALFLLQRGMSTGISIAAPSIILSALLGWDIFWTNVFMGGLLIIYTVTGGAKAVAYTQQAQLIIIAAGMVIAGYMVVHLLPEGVGFLDALHVGGKGGKLNVITSGIHQGHFDWKDQYNVFSGLIGGFFLALSYFGTDQSQVGRYLTARSSRESRLGLLMNGLVKVPMQFLILLVGVLVFSFYQFKPEPLYFNRAQVARLERSSLKDSLDLLRSSFDSVQKTKVEEMNLAVSSSGGADSSKWGKVQRIMAKSEEEKGQFRTTFKRWLSQTNGGIQDNDTNYIFLNFVVDYLPKGLVGLLIAVIFLAAWGSIAAALNSLASCCVIDFHKRFSLKTLTPKAEYQLSKWYSLFWGLFCIAVAQFAYNIGNSLIEAVNVLGSLFYGVMLGIFLVAFYLKKVRGTPVFISAVLIEAVVITLFWLNRQGKISLSFLWLNLVGALGVVLVSSMLNLVRFPRAASIQP